MQRSISVCVLNKNIRLADLQSDQVLHKSNVPIKSSLMKARLDGIMMSEAIPPR